MASGSVTIVMYHYVRDLPRTRYPRIKALLASEFIGQLDYMSRFYRFITMDQCLDSIYAGAELPPSAALLSFDDGYIDHYLTAFPILAERGLQGSFFPPVRAIADRRVLDVNKIHFVLASAADLDQLLKKVFEGLDQIREQYGFEDNETLYRKFAGESRFDPPEVIFIKRLLQKGLPRAARADLTDRLFKTYVTQDEAAFAEELYVSPAQLRLMLRQGMHVGSHGYEHLWLDDASPAEQERDVDASLSFLHGIGVPKDRWVMCYPYGAYNDSLIRLIQSRGCKAGLTSRVDIASLSRSAAFTLPRLDTNDLPKVRAADPASWTQRVLRASSSAP